MDSNEKNKQSIRNVVVPIYGILDGKKQAIGTAFFLSNRLLLTSAHTFYNGKVRKEEDFEILINGRLYSLNPPVFEDYPKEDYSQCDQIYLDLSIFNLNNEIIVQSYLSLSSICNEQSRIIIKGYPYGDNRLEPSSCEIENNDYSVITISNEPYSIRCKFINCMRLNTTVADGMSGGPVLNGTHVIGMLVSGISDVGTATAIKSEYILEKIKNLNLNNSIAI